jgi:hypothetical protein
MRRKEVCVYYRTDSSVAAHVLRRQVVSTYKAQAEGYEVAICDFPLLELGPMVPCSRLQCFA